MTAGLITSVLRGRSLALAGLALAAMVSTTAYAGTLYTSDLSNVTIINPPGTNTPLNVQVDYNGKVAGISNTTTSNTLGYNFDYQSAQSAHDLGADTNGGTNVKLKLDPTSVDTMDTQDKGAFLALDSVYQTSAIDLTGFTATKGQTYTLTFDYAATQQRGFSGDSSDFLTVFLNGSTILITPSIALPSPAGVTDNIDFSGYYAESITFTAASSGALSFLAGGTPMGNGQDPAFTLLDNINVSTPTTPPPGTPEPSSLILLSTGLVGLGGFIRRKSLKA